jgi:hypothetical protein
VTSGDEAFSVWAKAPTARSASNVMMANFFMVNDEDSG